MILQPGDYANLHQPEQAKISGRADTQAMFFQRWPRPVFLIPHVPPASTRVMSPAQLGIVTLGTYYLGNSKRHHAKAEGLIFLHPPKQGCLERLSFNPHADCKSFYIRPMVNKQGKNAVRDGKR